MATYSKTYRATAAPSVGANWSNAANIYDNDATTYASRSSSSTSATHINRFGINLPSNAVVNTIEVHSKLYASNSYGHLYVYLISDAETSDSTKRINTTKVVSGASFSAQYVTQTYTGEQLATKLSEIALYDGNVVEFLKGLRIRFVIGSTNSYSSSACRVYDNYVVVNYTIPDYTITVNATTGGTVTGGGTYESGRDIALTATANTGYKFKQWSDGNTNATRAVTVSGNATYTAQFEKITVLITASASPSEGGTIIGTGTYSYGDSYTLTAVPNDGYKFSRWSIFDSSPTITRKASLVDEDFTAYFELDKINKIYVGTQQPKEIYVGTTPVKAIYVGTTKVYG